MSPPCSTYTVLAVLTRGDTGVAAVKFTAENKTTDSA